MKNEPNNKRFWLATFLCVAGVLILITSLVLPPAGVISASVLAPVGEVFVLAGGILGIDLAAAKNIRDTVADELKRQQVEDDNEKSK